MAAIDRQILSFTWQLARALAISYVVVLAIAYVFQRRLQYFPDSNSVPVPRDGPFRGIEEVTLQAEDGVELKAWYWPGSRPISMLIFHGNAGNRVHRLDWMWRLHGQGLGVLVLDYRGYGGSGGSPSEIGFHRDALAAWDWLKQNTSDSIIAVGESIGAAVAIELASKKPVSGLIVQSGFTSATDVGREAYPFFPIRWLLKDRFENLSRIPHANCPLLVIHGDRDSIVPLSHGELLYAEAGSPKEWYCVVGAGHNDLIDVGGSVYVDRIVDFLDSIDMPPKAH